MDDSRDQLLSTEGSSEHQPEQPEGQQQQPQERLSLARKLLFGLAAPPLQMTSNICGFFFSLYLLEVVHLTPAQVSVITFSGRVWDAVTDPLVGQLVFRTRTRCGRTKPWLAAATVLGPASFLMMWQQLPGVDSGADQFVYHFLCYLAYCALITCYHVPYASSTMLISDNSKDKDGATACRIGFELLFTIIGSAVFGGIISQNRLAADCGGAASSGTVSPSRIRDERRGYALGALVISCVYFVCGLVATFGIKEAVKLDTRADSFLNNIRCVLTFGPYVLLMLAFLFMSLGIQTVQANLGLYTTHSISMGTHMNYGIFTVLTVAVVLVPFWARMSDRFGKKRIFMLGLIPMLPCLMLATVLPPGNLLAYYAVTCFSGLSISVAMLLPWSMLPDVIDDFYLRTGERKEATFYSLYVFFTKFASGVSLALSQLVLGLSGYDSNSCEQPYSVGTALRYLIGPGPIVCVCLSMLLMHFYPIDKEYRERLSKRLVEKLYSTYGTADGQAADAAPDGSDKIPVDEVIVMSDSAQQAGLESTENLLDSEKVNKC